MGCSRGSDSAVLPEYFGTLSQAAVQFVVSLSWLESPCWSPGISWSFVVGGVMVVSWCCGGPWVVSGGTGAPRAFGAAPRSGFGLESRRFGLESRSLASVHAQLVWRPQRFKGSIPHITSVLESTSLDGPKLQQHSGDHREIVKRPQDIRRQYDLRNIP